VRTDRDFRRAERLFRELNGSYTAGRDRRNRARLRHLRDLPDDPRQVRTERPERLPLHKQRGGYYDEWGRWWSSRHWYARSVEDAQLALRDLLPDLTLDDLRSCLRRGRKAPDQKAVYDRLSSAVSELRVRRSVSERLLCELLECSRSTIARLARRTN
jgi:hypothetical protein